MSKDDGLVEIQLLDDMHGLFHGYKDLKRGDSARVDKDNAESVLCPKVCETRQRERVATASALSGC